MNAAALQKLQADNKSALADAAELQKLIDGEKREFTPEEQAKFDGYLDTVEANNKAIKAAEADAARRDRLEALATDAEDSAGRIVGFDADRPVEGAPGSAGDDPHSFTVNAPPWMSSVRCNKLVCYPETPQGLRTAYTVGMWFRATFTGDDYAQGWCRDHGVKFTPAGAMSGLEQSKGGFLVPAEMVQAILTYRNLYGVFRRECRVLPMARDSMTQLRRSSGVTAYAIGPNTEITASDMAFDAVELFARKWGALTKISSELAEDAVIDLIDIVTEEMGYAFSQKEDDSGFKGDATSTYHGIKGITHRFENDSLTGAVDLTSGENTFAEVTAASLALVMAKLPDYAWARDPKWYCSTVCDALVFQALTAAAGGATISEVVAGRPRRAYLGSEIVITNSLPTSTGDLENSAMFLFGVLGMASTLGDRRTIRLKLLDQRYGELDQLGLVATTRFDINNHNLGDGTNAGPLVAGVGN